MKVTSYNKNGEEVNTKDLMLLNENVYKILKRYIQKPVVKKESDKRILVKAQ